jgi:hypothetical protein
MRKALAFGVFGVRRRERSRDLKGAVGFTTRQLEHHLSGADGFARRYVNGFQRPVHRRPDRNLHIQWLRSTKTGSLRHTLRLLAPTTAVTHPAISEQQTPSSGGFCRASSPLRLSLACAAPQETDFHLVGAAFRVNPHLPTLLRSGPGAMRTSGAGMRWAA